MSVDTLELQTMSIMTLSIMNSRSGINVCETLLEQIKVCKNLWAEQELTGGAQVVNRQEAVPDLHESHSSHKNQQ